MPTAAEAEADSPQTPEGESPAGNPDTELPSQTRGVVTSEENVRHPLQTRGGVTKAAGVTNSIEDQKWRPMKSPDEDKRP